MADRYNVDDILEEIKRKKSGSGSMISSRRAQDEDEAPVYSRYDQEPDEASYETRYTRSRSVDDYEEPPRRRRESRYEDDRYEDRYDDRYAARPARSRDYDDYDDYDDRPRRRPEPRREYEDYPAERRESRRYDSRYDEDYEEPRRPARRREDRYDDDRYDDRYTARPARSRDYDDYDDYDDRPRRRPEPRREYEDYPSERRESRRDEEPRSGFRFRGEAEDEMPAARTERYEEPPRRRRDEYEEPPRKAEPERTREPERSREPDDDLSILRDRISDNTPRRSRFADLEEEETSAPAAAPAAPQGVSGETIITSREDILKNFGRGRTQSFTRNFDAAKAERRQDIAAIQKEVSGEEEPPVPDDYTATQMNIDLYSMDEQGNSKAETERRDRRRRQKEEKGEPVVEEELDDLTDEVDDFNTPKDANKVYARIRKTKKGLMIRLGLSVVLFALMCYLTVSLKNINLPLLTFMLPEKNMRVFMGVNLGVLVLAVLLNISTILGGLKALFTLRPSGDGPVAVAALAAVIQGIVLIVFPDQVTSDNVGYYFAVVILVLIFNLIGKLFMINRVDQNFRLLAEGGYQRHAFNIINDRNLARELTQNLDLEQPVVGYSQPADFLTNFMHLSFTEDFGENVSRITTPIFLVADLVCSIIVMVIYGDPFLALTVFSAATLLSAPLTSTIVGNLPLRRMNKALSQDGSMVAGYTALDRFDDINCFVIRDSELFGPQSITLHGIKTFDQKRIDEAMVDAASIVCKSDCVLSYIFTQMIGGNEKILKKADSIVYEDSMGISAWVDGKRVLIGNRELMMNHNIEIPSKDYEKKFVKDGREVLYLANSGELTAIFVLSYAADPDIVDELGVLVDRDIGISVYTTDSNITPQKISELFDFPEDMVEIVPYKLHGQCDRLMAHKDRARAEIVYNGSLASKVRTLSGIITAKTSILLGVILQGVGMTLGYFAVCLLAFTNSNGNGFGTLSFTLLIAYQLFWGLITMLLPNLRRY